MNSRTISLVVMTLACCCAALAQDQKKVGPLGGIVVIEGPFVLDKDGDVIGHVLKRFGEIATFQTCSGPVLFVKESRLSDTKLDCEDEPSDKPNPVNFVSCEEVLGEVRAFLSPGKSDLQLDPLGTVYQRASTGQVEKLLPTATASWNTWSKSYASPVTVCNNQYVYFPDVGAKSAWVGYLKKE